MYFLAGPQESIITRLDCSIHVTFVSREQRGEWSNNDFILLAKAVAKFPGGCSERWEKIADMMDRPVAEVGIVNFLQTLLNTS